MQVDASLQNQNLRSDLRWVAKRIRKSALKFTQVAKVVNFTFIQMTCDQLVPSASRKLALTCESVWPELWYNYKRMNVVITRKRIPKQSVLFCRIKSFCANTKYFKQQRTHPVSHIHSFIHSFNIQVAEVLNNVACIWRYSFSTILTHRNYRRL